MRTTFIDAVGAQKGAGVTCVFAGDVVRQRQHMQGTQAYVGQISDRRGHHIERTFRIILGTGRFVGGFQGGVK